MTGVMHELTRPFVQGGIAVFALSTWYACSLASSDEHPSLQDRNTDYLLIPLSKADKGIELLRQHGWTVEEA